MSVGAYLSHKTKRDNRRKQDRKENGPALQAIPDSESQKSPTWIGGITYASFILIGLVPLGIYVVDMLHPIGEHLFAISCLLTSLGFIAIGWLKAYVNRTQYLKGILETVVLGSLAALLAFFVGDILEKLLL
jgi:VIT1/CCC1 family predicted Fe2+/Mn2+ transporter